MTRFPQPCVFTVSLSTVCAHCARQDSPAKKKQPLQRLKGRGSSKPKGQKSTALRSYTSPASTRGDSAADIDAVRRPRNQSPLGDTQVEAHVKVKLTPKPLPGTLPVRHRASWRSSRWVIDQLIRGPDAPDLVNKTKQQMMKQNCLVVSGTLAARH